MTSLSQIETEKIVQTPSFRVLIYKRLSSNLFTLLAACCLVAIVALAVIVPLFSSYTYYDIDLSSKNQPPSWLHWFGTDDLGRDMFVRVWYGARISLFVGVTAALIDLVLGIIWGGVAALCGGKIDEVMMRLADVLYALPSLLVVTGLMVVLGPGLVTILIALSLLGWITMARVVRGQLLILKEQGYVYAARALGACFWRIFFRHLLPNAFGPIIVTLTLTVPSAIFTEAFLSYLGLGVQAPIASWGTISSEGLPALEYYPWRLFFPAGLICLTMLAFNILGDGLSDVVESGGKCSG